LTLRDPPGTTDDEAAFVKDPAQLTVPDYLAIGHIAADITPEGTMLGGTVAYSGLTARALGLRVALVTSFGPEIDPEALGDIAVHHLPAPQSTTFQNTYTPTGRRQRILHRAPGIGPDSLPSEWVNARIVHLAPIAQEVDPDILTGISTQFIGVTPQGWMRRWDANGHVSPAPWRAADRLLARAAAVVLSMGDVQGDEARIQDLAASTPVLVVTEGARGARVYWERQMRLFSAPDTQVLDSTGAGDILAACFFVRLYQTRDPWEAARFATRLSAASVGRRGIASVPRRAEIEAALTPRLP
jgi:sugar/nucleoside kinase (ribokinase family)